MRTVTSLNTTDLFVARRVATILLLPAVVRKSLGTMEEVFLLTPTSISAEYQLAFIVFVQTGVSCKA
jgi:hypothetical protein